ncbi:MAG TPA: COX15/CtaA family protein [Casimicrobiaceae bacterium]|nr:COX15/CtaA family protein [Casimicrobiaceae bacterium]
MSTALSNTPVIANDAPPRRLLRLLTVAGITLVLVIIVASAYMRLSAAGLSCADWPACYGRVGNAFEATAGVRIARIAHRLAASAVAGLTLAIVALGFVVQPRRVAQIALAMATLAVVVGLAVLGIATSKLAGQGPPLPAVTLANLLGGFLLLALLVALCASTLQSLRVPVWVRAVGLVALVVAAIQVVLGGFVSARFAGLACPAFPLCGAEAPAGSLAAALDPFAPLAVDANNTILRPPALAALQSAHRVAAHAMLFLAIALAIGLARARCRRVAIAVIVPVVVELALGASAAIFELPLFVVLAHNLVAALLLATLVVVNERAARPGGDSARRSESRRYS